MEIGNNKISYKDVLEIAKELTGKRELIIPKEIAERLETAFIDMDKLNEGIEIMCKELRALKIL